MLLALAFLWVVTRTESLHVLSRRLWLLVHGNHEIADPEIRAYVEEQASLMSFRMYSGIRAHSLEEARQLLRWARFNGVEVRKIGLCGDYFDPELRQVLVHKLPPAWWQKMKIAALVCSYVLAVACFIAALQFTSLAVTLNSTQQWLLVNDNSVRHAWPPFGAPKLARTDCTQPHGTLATRLALSEPDVASLCKMLGDKSFKDDLAPKVAQQRWAFALLGAAGLAGCLWLFSAWVPAAAARRLAARNIDPALPGTQRALDF